MPDIHWKLHLGSPVERVYEYLSTDAGRKQFWAENTVEDDGYITFEFINGLHYKAEILEADPPGLYSIDYFNSTVIFRLQEDEKGGTDLILDNKNVSDQDYPGMYPGWLSVLLALKAMADYGVDLRNHDSQRTWDQGYVDN